MTTPTGYTFTFNGETKDFSEMFESQMLNSLSLSEYNVNGVPLGTQFRGGNGGFNTGYNINNVDLGGLLEAKLPFTSSGHTVFGTTDNYTYAIFTDVNNSGVVNPRYYDASYPVRFIVVGGGGGGGRAVGGISNGGGGGGGVYLFEQTSDMFNKNMIITVGRGGAASTADNQTGGTGEPSIVNVDGINWFQSDGGNGGSNTAGGDGGKSIRYGLLEYYNTSHGGDGGDQSDGGNAYYFEGGPSLNVPTEIVSAQKSYISNYYSGGGGGSKGSQDDYNWPGGRGGSDHSKGNTFGNGLGGTRGILDDPPSVGSDGEYWGAGGGAGGSSSGGTRYNGGAGVQGIVIAYAQIKKASLL